MRYGFPRMPKAATTASRSTVSAEGVARAAASTTGTPCLNGQTRRSEPQATECQRDTPYFVLLVAVVQLSTPGVGLALVRIATEEVGYSAQQPKLLQGRLRRAPSKVHSLWCWFLRRSTRWDVLNSLPALSFVQPQSEFRNEQTHF